LKELLDVKFNTKYRVEEKGMLKLVWQFQLEQIKFLDGKLNLP
jgi:hypothetical protein